ncbi:sodium:proton antiporter [Planococcus glaciei]|uniref:Na+/H+ antiporter family protein n=1 Tax=Planococcus glaciei TaxID=459472 RepID=A0A7H8Q8X9_9BACL|nr:Na+/H+ antiporter family protein [Planococcus glaciei]MCP2036800.1 putative histidine transporter YuiF (NhaC family) [Planomicrobium sp. HSC-17F08]ETP69731.1 sodium:proton antiporter [Planococcus glaciei CHR43]KOF09426.1 sodium:proton antiporter [Planococcus glaciei]QDY45414.1 Na+/H+ antiporter family protein [Planococcus glaciei]QKX50454.1 Na+/H+ antiporter family protein [Planococcus glaciei]
MNAVIIAVLVMLVLSLFRVNVVFALLIGALAGGLSGGLSLMDTVTAYTGGLGAGATIALSYAMLGGFAVAISRTGIPELLVSKVLKLVNKEGEGTRENLAKALVIFALLAMAILSQNAIPIHIAFIPLLVPPILHILNELRIDRRLIASVLTFGLTAPYILLPYGFGLIFHEIVATQMELAGLPIDMADIPKAMAIPVAGMAVGLAVAVFISYRKPRDYHARATDTIEETQTKTASTKDVIVTLVALAAALYGQIQTDSMIIGALSGILVLYVFGAMKWREADDVLTAGMRMMAFIGFVMISANGFASVITATGEVEPLVESVADLFAGNKGVAALVMLIVGLLVTMGIGSSFATIPIIAAIFVPLSMEFGFSTLAIISLIGTAGALGDAGSPASDSTLGPTAGLNVDGQHNHIWDTCVPTFLHYNIPLIVFGWMAVMVLG